MKNKLMNLTRSMNPVRSALLVGFVSIAVCLLTSSVHSQTTIGFESNLSAGALNSNSFYNGGPVTNSDPWTADGISFNNTFTDFGTFTTWAGWSYSNVMDSATAGFGNQYASYPGSGSGGSSNYAVGFDDDFNDVNPRVDFGVTVESVSVDLSNTTYAVFAMRDGDDGGNGFARQFGDNDGMPGNDGVEDFFLLEITGFDELGVSTGTFDFYLADYRAADNADDYVLEDWTNVDLSSLGQVSSLSFQLESTDVGSPNYFAADNLRFTVSVPEPSSTIFLSVLAGLGFARRKRK